MTELSTRNFGLLIAYILPGFVVLWGVSAAQDSLRGWLFGIGREGPTAAGVVYVLLFSIGAGMAASVVRWALLDSILHRSGIHRPSMDFSRLNEHLSAFDRLVEHHYQYYQFYGNTFIAALAAYPAWRLLGRGGADATDIGFFVLEVFFAAGARDALRNYYARASQLLGHAQEHRHDQRFGTSRKDQGPRDQGAGEGQARQGDHGGGGTAVAPDIHSVRSEDASEGVLNDAGGLLTCPYEFGRL